MLYVVQVILLFCKLFLIEALGILILICNLSWSEVDMTLLLADSGCNLSYFLCFPSFLFFYVSNYINALFICELVQMMF